MAFGDLKGTLTGNANNVGATLAISTGGPITVAVGDLVYAVIAEQATASVTACADNLTNTYAATSAAADAGTISTGRAYWTRVTNPGSLSSVTFTTAATTDNVVAIAAVIEGPFAQSPLDANPANTTNDNTTPYTCPTTGTLAQASEAVLCWVVHNGTPTFTATSPNVEALEAPTQAILTLAVGRQTVAATTAVTPEWTATATPTQSCYGTTSFKAATQHVGLAQAAGAGSLSVLFNKLLGGEVFGGVGSFRAGAYALAPANRRARIGALGEFSIGQNSVSPVARNYLKQGEARFAGGNRLLARDEFNRADGGLGSSWTSAVSLPGLVIASNVVAPTISNTHSASYWSADTFADDQFSECTVAQLSGVDGAAFLGLTVRHQVATASFYVAYFSSGSTVTIYKWISGSAFLLGSIVGLLAVAGDVIRFEVSGSSTVTLVVKVNGTVVNSATDSSSPYISGYPGINIYAPSPGFLGKVDNWNAGPISGIAANFSVDAVVVRVGVQVSSNFSGLGNFSVNVTAGLASQTSFSGTGGLSVSSAARMAAAATFAGQGALSSYIVNFKNGEARFIGAGSLSVDATKVSGGTVQQGDARFSGTGLFSVNATLVQRALATFSGAGSLSALDQLGLKAEARFGGIGNLSVTLTQAGTSAGEARFAGAGGFSANATLRQAVQATLQGVGSISALPSLAQKAASAFAGAGNFSIHGIKLVPLIPDGDSSTGGWLTEVDSLPLFPSIDEMVPLDADYIKSGAAPIVDICKISLSNPTTATLVAPVSVLYRYGKSGTDTAQLQVRLLQGTTMIAIWQHTDIAVGFVTVEQFLTDPMIANITDWNDLFLEFRSGTITAHMGRATFAGIGVM